MSERLPAIRLPSGEEYGTDTLEIARTHYPDAEWIGYQDGERFEEPRPLAEVETDPSKMTRDELNAAAAERGIADPASFRTKADLIAAMESPAGVAPVASPIDVVVEDGDGARNAPRDDEESEDGT